MVSFLLCNGCAGKKERKIMIIIITKKALQDEVTRDVARSCASLAHSERVQARYLQRYLSEIRKLRSCELGHAVFQKFASCRGELRCDLY